MAAHGDPLGAKKRLDSWKEIATFFGRDERTVNVGKKNVVYPSIVCREVRAEVCSPTLRNSPSGSKLPT